MRQGGSSYGEKNDLGETVHVCPEFEMIIPVPTDRDDEEYIDELLDGILNDEFRYNIEWDFVDGLS